ncbi:hypothetical protein Trydic_g20039 [Trypoxylus dichotomus]
MKVPCGIYGSGSWIITKVNERRIQALERVFLIRAAGYTRMDRKINTDIREELGVINVNIIIREYRQNWSKYGQIKTKGRNKLRASYM